MISGKGDHDMFPVSIFVMLFVLYDSYFGKRTASTDLPLCDWCGGGGGSLRDLYGHRNFVHRMINCNSMKSMIIK